MAFGYEGLQSNEAVTPDDEKQTDLSSGKEDEKDKQTLDSPPDDNKNEDDKKEESSEEEKPADDKKEELNLQAGTKIEIDNTSYTIDDKGNLVDEKGVIFKEASQVNDYLKSLEQSDEDVDKEISIDNVVDAIGIDILDDQDKPVKFENTPEGIKQYVNAVIQTTQQEIADSTINSLYSRYPIVKEVLDYYIANGNSLDGFSGRPDRSNIVVDENNEAQQEAIIRAAWDEQGRKGSVDNYIAYLKSSGTLKTVAEEELEGLKQADADYKRKLADEAKAREQAELEEQKQYWKGVKDIIDTKKIAGYQIPDTILIERNGQKIAATPGDFFNYIYQTDKEGYTQYQRDLLKDTPESRRDDEILRAYLKFVGGNYSNLVDMAIKEKEVAKLKFKAKEAGARKTSYKITPPTKEDKKDINLGY